MKLPILEFDPSPEALLEPAKLIQPHPEMPAGCALGFFHDVIRHLGEKGLLTEITSLRSEMGKHPVTGSPRRTATWRWSIPASVRHSPPG